MSGLFLGTLAGNKLFVVRTVQFLLAFMFGSGHYFNKFVSYAPEVTGRKIHRILCRDCSPLIKQECYA